MLCWRYSLNDYQLAAATRARQRKDTGRLIGIAEAVVVGVILVWRLGPELVSDPSDIGGTVAISEDAIVSDAVLALWQHMDQEPPDELVCLQRHGFVSIGTVYTVVFDAEGDALIVHADQTVVGDGDPLSWFAVQTTAGQRDGCIATDRPVRRGVRRRVPWRRPPS